MLSQTKAKHRKRVLVSLLQGKTAVNAKPDKGKNRKSVWLVCFKGRLLLFKLSINAYKIPKCSELLLDKYLKETMVVKLILADNNLRFSTL